jgi:hypothetical protein
MKYSIPLHIFSAGLWRPPPLILGTRIGLRNLPKEAENFLPYFPAFKIKRASHPRERNASRIRVAREIDR